MRSPIDGGTVLVTGASSGIGRELARLLAPRAGTLLLVARREERLTTLREELTAAHPTARVQLYPCDVADPAALAALLGSLEDAGTNADVLVNNAGFGYYARYDRADWDHLDRMIRVNVTALARLTRWALPGMVARGRGGIMNIGSGAGYAPMTGAAAYVGTKHFVAGFSETLRLELAGTGVLITDVAPGPVESEFGEVAGITDASGGPPSFMRISAAQCAREALRGFEGGRALVFPGSRYRALMSLYFAAPRFLTRLVMRPHPPR